MVFENLMTNGSLWEIMMGMIVVSIIVFIGLYVYLGFAFMTIGKKAKLSNPALAWIPGVGPLIIAFQASKMPWWPWLLLIGVIIPAIGGLFSLAFSVFAVIWQWKMFEKIKYPGWWAILALVPVLNLVLYGIAAWSKKK
jgi:magnesium-transporting ATPase (P-type)